MNKRKILSSGDWQLLSAYLDNQLSDKEKRQVDERLQTDPEYRQALELLLLTSKLLRSLPVRRVPRNFTLSAQSVQEKIIPSFMGVLRYSSAAAALLLVVAFAVDFLQQPDLVAAGKTVEDIQLAAVAMKAARVPAAEPPMIIYWGAPAPVMGLYGKGGGGGGAEGPGFYGVGGGGAGEPSLAPSVEFAPAAEATPMVELAVPETTEGVQPPEVEPLVQTAPALEPLTGSGPILGVRAPEERETADVVTEIPLRQPTSRTEIPFRLIEIVLAALLLITAIPAWLLKRK